MSNTPSALNALPDGITLETNAHGRSFLCIKHSNVSARIAFTGAHIVHCQPSGEDDLLWMSPADPQQPGTALRGGVPICWPWFGGDRLGAPAHGVARTADWQLDGVTVEHQKVRVNMSIPPESLTQLLPEEAWAVSVEFVLGHSLTINLTTRNIGSEPQLLSQALHTYLPVSDLASAEIHGLTSVRYLDKLTGEDRAGETQALTINGEVDRVYYQYAGPVKLRCNGMKDRVITRNGCSALVVWNPGADKGATLSQFPTDGHQHMLCIEAANAGPDKRLLAPWESHTLSTTIGYEP
ncbi:D-hexose-6-phosphate mutarotase [Salinispirillum sp. LH 10-3-1]|uniref:Putative glucose-6-phosphate 1-epimerase n=1 Tax=Salinispirillum sp. LH 10-3-1 TaxID=2952525 RepID=A0AB38YEG7_9GAMM